MDKTGRWETQSHTQGGHNMINVDESGTQGHFLSNKMYIPSEQRIETDSEYKKRIYKALILPKVFIKEEFGNEVSSFAYPFGDYGQGEINNPEAENTISDYVSTIYSMAFYQVWEGHDYTFNYSDNDHFFEKRINVKPNWTDEDLLAVLEKGQHKELPYADNFQNDMGWLKNWGKFEIKDNNLILSTSSSTGALIFLDGTYLWENYISSATVNIQKGQTISLLALYHDADNYLSCNFNEEGITINERIDGEDNNVLTLNEDINNLKNQDIQIGISVSNNRVRCLMNNSEIIGASYLDFKSKQGGIGFKIWDSQPENGELVIKDLNIEKLK
jgi:hypothetical protein